MYYLYSRYLGDSVYSFQDRFLTLIIIWCPPTITYTSPTQHNNYWHPEYLYSPLMENTFSNQIFPKMKSVFTKNALNIGKLSPALTKVWQYWYPSTFAGGDLQCLKYGSYYNSMPRHVTRHLQACLISIPATVIRNVLPRV